jgi:hypothetical protein
MSTHQMQCNGTKQKIERQMLNPERKYFQFFVSNLFSYNIEKTINNYQNSCWVSNELKNIYII